jgi:hypothetical protein
MQQFLDCLPVLLNPPRTVDLSARGEPPPALYRAANFARDRGGETTSIGRNTGNFDNKEPEQKPQATPARVSPRLLEHPPQYKAKVSTRCSFGRTGRGAPCSHAAVTPIYDRDQGSSANRSGDDPFTTLDKGDTTANRSASFLFISSSLFITETITIEVRCVKSGRDPFMSPSVSSLITSCF